MSWKPWKNQTFISQMEFSKISKVPHLHFLFGRMLYPALECFHDNTSTLETRSSYCSHRLANSASWTVCNLLSSRICCFPPSHSLYRNPNLGLWFTITKLWICVFSKFPGHFFIRVVFNWEWCFPPGGIWQCLKIFLVVTLESSRWKTRIFSPFSNAWDSPLQERITQP